MNQKGTFALMMAREMRDGLFNPLVLGAVVVLAACLVFATLLAGDSYRWNLNQYEELNAPQEASQTANLGATVAIRPLPLQVLAKGPGDAMSRPLSAMRQLEAAYNIKYNVGQERRQRDLVLSLAEDIDPLFVLKLLLPILAMFISHAMICGEKEAGTLRMTLANSVRRRTVLFAKLAAGAALLALALALFALAIMVTIWGAGIAIPADLMPNLALILAATYLYGLLFLFAGAAISTITHRADLSMLVCLGTWVVTVIVLPGIAAGLAEVTDGAPPAHLVYARKLALERAVRGGDAMEGGAEGMRTANSETLTAIGGIDAEFFEEVRQQEQTALAYGIISPALDYQVIVTALSQSGLEEERELMRQVRRHFLALAEFDAPEQELFNRTVPDELPVFTYTHLPLEKVLIGTLIPWIALCLMTVALLAFAVYRFERYDVR